MRQSLGFYGLCSLCLSGCVLLGYDPDLGSDPQPSGAAGSGSGSGTSGSGGNAGAADINTPVAGSAGSNGGASGTGASGTGASGASGDESGNGGAAGIFDWPRNAGTGGTAGLDPDAGPPVATCVGAPSGSACDDGLYCTDGDFCLAQTCVPGAESPCETSQCSSSRCDEDEDSCQDAVATPGEQCGLGGWFQCQPDGTCGQPIVCEEGEDCSPTCDDAACPVRCNGVDPCQTTCINDAQCFVSCEEATQCAIDCVASTCATDCDGSTSCDVECSDGAECYIICRDGYECSNIRCLADSWCKIECTEDDNCDFSECWDAVQTCDDGSIVCGGPCR